nr:hypothetical protein [Tanacetum cinerariifolium]GEW40399.1 hypothetical protein [Tanacetum cinerariifolium]
MYKEVECMYRLSHNETFRTNDLDPPFPFDMNIPAHVSIDEGIVSDHACVQERVDEELGNEDEPDDVNHASVNEDNHHGNTAKVNEHLDNDNALLENVVSIGGRRCALNKLKKAFMQGEGDEENMLSIVVKFLCLGDDLDLQPNSKFTFISDKQKVQSSCPTTILPPNYRVPIEKPKKKRTRSLCEKDEMVKNGADTSGGVFDNQGQASESQAWVNQADLVESQAFGSQANRVRTQTSLAGRGNRVNSVQGGATNHSHTNAGTGGKWAMF